MFPLSILLSLLLFVLVTMLSIYLIILFYNYEKRRETGTKQVRTWRYTTPPPPTRTIPIWMNGTISLPTEMPSVSARTSKQILISTFVFLHNSRMMKVRPIWNLSVRLGNKISPILLNARFRASFLWTPQTRASFLPNISLFIQRPYLRITD